MIRTAIVGAGNCASSLVQGLGYYTQPNPVACGLMEPVIGRYTPKDIEIAAAFDIDARKVGLGINQAIFAEPNCTWAFHMPTGAGVEVQRGPTLDGLGSSALQGTIPESSRTPVDVAQVLKDQRVDVVVGYLPVGSEEAVRFYADAAIQAGCAYVNCVPVFLASDAEFAQRFRDAGLPLIGDDIKSQVGATIVHRVLANLMHVRGVELTKTSQLNVGGNNDFRNMLDRSRLASKKQSKTQAVTSVMGVPLEARNIHIGPSDHVEWLDDRKWAYIYLEGRGFGGAPMRMEVKLEVWDSPNSAGIVMDAIRCAQLARDRGESGPIHAPSACYMKSPPVQVVDHEAYERLQEWLA